MAPRPPKTAQDAAEDYHYATWNEFVEEATANVKPFGLLLPDDTEPTIFPCPSGDQMEAFGAAGRAMDDTAAAVALFGVDLAPRILQLSAGQPFVVRARLFQKVMAHYGMQMADLPKS